MAFRVSSKPSFSLRCFLCDSDLDVTLEKKMLIKEIEIIYLVTEYNPYTHKREKSLGIGFPQSNPRI